MRSRDGGFSGLYACFNRVDSRFNLATAGRGVRSTLIVLLICMPDTRKDDVKG